MAVLIGPGMIDRTVIEEAVVSNPGARYFQTFTVRVDVWVHPNADLDTADLADRVQSEICNAADEAAKRLSCPDEGVEVVVR